MHGDAHGGRRQGRRIVDAVAHHDDRGPLLTQSLDVGHFLLRRRVARGRVGRRPAAARPPPPPPPDDRRTACESSSRAAAVPPARTPHPRGSDRPSPPRPRSGRRPPPAPASSRPRPPPVSAASISAGIATSWAPHEPRRTDDQAPAVHQAGQASAGRLHGLANFGQRCDSRDGVRPATARRATATGCDECDSNAATHGLGLVAADPGNHPGLARRDRARLVQDHHARPREQLQDFAALDQNSPPGRPAQSRPSRPAASPAPAHRDKRRSAGPPRCRWPAAAPRHSQPTNVAAASPSSTTTNQPATRSANWTIGARRRLHSSTRFISRPTRVWPPTASTRTTNREATFTVPALTAWPGSTATGRDSPLSSDWSSVDCPSSTVAVHRHGVAGADFDPVARRHRFDRHFLDPVVRQHGAPTWGSARTAVPPRRWPTAAAAAGSSGPPAAETPASSANRSRSRRGPERRSPSRPVRRRAAPRQSANPNGPCASATPPRRRERTGCPATAGRSAPNSMLVQRNSRAYSASMPENIPAVQRKGQRHHVAGTGRRHADADQEAMVLPPPQLAGPHVASRMRRVAQRVQHPRDAGQLDPLVLPANSDQAAAHVQPRLDHAGQHLRQFFHQPDASRTVDAFQVQFRGLRRRRPTFGSTGRGTPRRRTRRTAAASCAPAWLPRRPTRGAGRNDPAHSRGSPGTRSGSPGSRTARRRPDRPTPPARAGRSECNGRRAVR